MVVAASDASEVTAWCLYKSILGLIMEQVIAENYLGEMPGELKHNALKEYLKNPGDFVIYSCLEMDDRLIVDYFREVEIVAYEIGVAQSFGRFYVSKKDFEEQLNGDMIRLKTLIKTKLKIQIAWDFDKTLTREHTWPGLGNPPADKKKNQKYKEQTDCVLHAIASHPKFINTIAINNYEANTREYLVEWYGSEEQVQILFADIQGRYQYAANGRSKTSSIVDSVNVLTDGAINSDDFLNLNTPLFISIVAVYLVDDAQESIDIAREFGIHEILVNEYGIQHLNQLNRELNLGLVLGVSLQEDEVHQSPMQSIIDESTALPSFQ